jgi:serine/threonine protein kinase
MSGLITLPAEEAADPRASGRAFSLLLAGVHMMAGLARTSHQAIIPVEGALAARILSHVWPGVVVMGASLVAYALIQRQEDHPRRSQLLVALYLLHCAGTSYADALSIDLSSYTVQHSWLTLGSVAYALMISGSTRHHLAMQAVTVAALPFMMLARFVLGGYGAASGGLVAAMTLVNLLPIVSVVSASVLLFIYISRERERIKQAANQLAQMGSYILERKLGEGGMGEVWKARHSFLARPAALKVIRTDALDLEEGAHQESADTIAMRFDREARVTAALTSPHTVRLYDFGQATTGTFFYAMEYLKGLDLEQLVEKYGPQPQARVIHILKQICDSLAEAHQAGLIHRDIKPANIMLCRQGTQYDFVKVLDFGLVVGRATSPLEGLQGEGPQLNQRLTQQGIIRGTPACMSPEQAVAAPDLDHRTDIYALGCVAYFLLTGRDVFEAPTSLAVLVQHLKNSPKLPSQRVPGLQIHEDLEVLVMQCLAKDPAGRPQSAQELIRALDAIDVPVWTQSDAARWYARLGHTQEGPDASAQWVIPPELRERLKNMRSSDSFEQGAAPGAQLARKPPGVPGAKVR